MTMSDFSTAGLFEAGSWLRTSGEWLLVGKSVTMRAQGDGLYEIEVRMKRGSLVVRARGEDMLIKLGTEKKGSP